MIIPVSDALGRSFSSGIGPLAFTYARGKQLDWFFGVCSSSGS